MAVIDELVTLLGFELSDKAKSNIKAAEKGIEDISKAAFKMAAVVSAAASGFGLYVKNVSENAAEMEKMAKATGQSTTQLQEWSYVANRVSADAATVQGDLAKLQQKFYGMPIDQIADKLAGQFAGMSEQQKRMYAQFHNIAMDTVKVMELGKEGIAGMIAEGHSMGAIIPEATIKAAAAFDRGLKTLWFTFRSIADQVAMGTTPKLLELVEATQKWLAENQALVREGLSGVLAGIGSAFDLVRSAAEKVWNWFKKLLPETEGLRKKLFTFENVAKFVRAGLVLLAILLAPLIVKFLLIAAAVTAVVLVFDSLMAAFRGGDSVIGNFVKNAIAKFEEKFPNLSKAIEKATKVVGEFIAALAGDWWSNSKGGLNDLEKAFDAVVKVVERYLKVVDDFFGAWDKADTVEAKINAIADLIKGHFTASLQGAIDLIPTLSGLANPFQSLSKAIGGYIGNLLKGPIEDLKEGIGKAIDWIKEKLAEIGTAISSAIPEPIRNLLGGAMDSVAGFLGGKEVQEGAAGVQHVRAQGGRMPTAANGNTANDNRQTTQNVTINVASGDPQVIAQATTNALAASAPSVAM